MPAKQPTSETPKEESKAETPKEESKAEVKPTVATAIITGPISFAMVKAFTNSLTDELSPEDIRVRTFAFLNQALAEEEKLDTAIDYLKPKITRLPHCLTMEDLEIVHKKFPTMGIEEVNKHEAKGESANNLMDELTTLKAVNTVAANQANQYAKVLFFKASLLQNINSKEEITPAKKGPN